MKINVDTKQRIQTGLLFFIEFYKILMGTFLIAFVPQLCGDKVCSLRENITNTDSTIHVAANISNLFTFLFVCNFYYRELTRENWCIKYLDIDESKALDFLDHEIEAYPDVKQKMLVLNRKYMNSIYMALATLTGNFIISGVSIGYDYVGTNTITSIVSFFMLVAMKLSSAYTVGKESIRDEHAMSSYMKTYKTFNTIDSDFRIIDNEARPEIEEIKEDSVDVSVTIDNN